MRILLTAALSLLLGASSLASALGPHPVTIETADGITLDGWYIHPRSVPHEMVHDADAEAFAEYPAVVLLHMYGGDKADWGPILGRFFERDIAALAIDMRGHGKRTTGLDGEDLAPRVRNRDEALFNSMWQDAAAAVDWLEAQGHRRDRIGLLGASVGCSVAIDAARRDPTLRVVAVLSPGTSYLGIDTLEHLSDWGDRTLLIVSSEEEWPTGAKQIQAQFEQSSTSAGDTDQPALDTWLLTGTGREVHGTRMLGRVDGIEGRLGDWFLQKLSPRKAPDPEVKPGGGDAGEAEEAHAPDNARVEATSQGAPEIDEPWRPPQPPAAEKRSDERAIMVSSQMASPSDSRTPVRDERVLAAIKAVPRHAFVPRSRQDLAYQDTPLPIGHGQTISQPYIVGLMSEQLNIDEHSKVLEIGTGSGYQAAVLAHLTPHVYSVEIIEPLAERAKATLSAQGYSQIKLRRGDGYHGWPEMGPYDAIIVTCAAGHLPPPLWEQLSPGGRIVIPIGGRYESQRLVVLEKLQDGSRRSRTVTGVRFVPLTREQGS